MKIKNIITVLLISFILASCASTTIVVPIETAVPTLTFATIPATPTITLTPDPMANAPEGTTGFDETTGEPIREITYENGQIFEFHFNEKGEWVREVGKFALMDNGYYKNIPFTLYLSESVPGGEAILGITHTNDIERDNNRPLTSRIRYMFIERLGLAVDDPEFYRLMNEEMDKGKNSEAKLPLITSDGDSTFVRLGNETGVILKIINAEDLALLVEIGQAIQWFDEQGGTYYLRVTVDENNNAVCTAASVLPLDKLTDRAFRNFIFSCVSHVFTQEDQREFLNYTNTQVLASVSANIVSSTGKPDIEIEYK